MLATAAVLLAAAAAPAPADLTPVKLSTPSVTAAGAVQPITITVANRGRRAARKSIAAVKGGRGSVKVGRIKPGRKRRVTVPAKVPANATGKLRLTVCVDSARKVKERSEKNNCRTTPELTVAATGGLGLIAAELAAKAISPETAVRLRLQLLGGDPKLPARYRSAAPPPDDHAGLIGAFSEWGSLPAAARARLAPYLAPGPIRDGLLAGGRRTRQSGGCRFFPDDTLQGIDAAGGNAAIWFPKDVPALRAYATQAATDLTAAWNKLVPEFKAPKSDAGVCYGGPDGRFDVYLTVPVPGVPLADVKPLGLYAAEGAFDPVGFCTDTPSVMTIYGRQSRSTIAHELMHAIQFAYRYASCTNTQNRWWDEGGGGWAADFVHAQDDEEHAYQAAAFEEPHLPLPSTIYSSQVFWTTMTRADDSIAVMKAVFAQLQTKRVREAVDAALPGGIKRQFPRYLRHLVNKPPVGEPGFPAAASLFAWDRVQRNGLVFRDTPLQVGFVPEQTVKVPVAPPSTYHCGPGTEPLTIGNQQTTEYCADGLLGPLSGTIQRFTLPDAQVREITLTNALHGEAGAHVEGWLKLAGGGWEVRDWTEEDEVTLCRDEAADDVQELYLVAANVHPTRRFAVSGREHSLKVRAQCPPPEAFSGTFTGSLTQPNPPQFQLSVTGGSVRFANRSEGGGGFNGYTSVSGSATVSLHFIGDYNCSVDGTTTVDFAPGQFGPPGQLNLYAGKQPPYQIILGFRNDHKVPLTKSNCDEPSENGKTSEWPLYGSRALVVPNAGDPPLTGTEDRRLAGSLTYSEGPQTYDFTWNLAPEAPVP